MAPLLAVLLLAAVASADSGRCPDSWSLSGNQCYWVSTFDVPWASIANMCSAVQPSSKPASVHDLATNSDLEILLQGKSAWLGLIRPSSSGNWSWQDGTELDFQYWDSPSGEPFSDGNCGYINHDHVPGQWGAESCGYVKPAVCQIPAVPAVCPEGWSEFEGKCYYYSGFTKLPWASVAAACNSLVPGAVPASIHSDAQNAFLLSLQTGYQGPYIGLSRPNSSAAWAWSDGSPLDYRNWGSGEPASSDLCVFINKNVDGGKWQGCDCDGVYPFACQADL